MILFTIVKKKKNVRVTVGVVLFNVWFTFLGRYAQIFTKKSMKKKKYTKQKNLSPKILRSNSVTSLKPLTSLRFFF